MPDVTPPPLSIELSRRKYFNWVKSLDAASGDRCLLLNIWESLTDEQRTGFWEQFDQCHGDAGKLLFLGAVGGGLRALDVLKDIHVCVPEDSNAPTDSPRGVH